MLISTNPFINQASTRSVQCAPSAQTLKFQTPTAAAKRPAPFCANSTEARPAKDGGGVGSGGEEENFGA